MTPYALVVRRDLEELRKLGVTVPDGPFELLEDETLMRDYEQGGCRTADCSELLIQQAQISGGSEFVTKIVRNPVDESMRFPAEKFVAKDLPAIPMKQLPSSVSHWMYRILAEMDALDEIGGPTPEEYALLMDEIARVAIERARLARREEIR
jgi:hypothetical protein